MSDTDRILQDLRAVLPHGSQVSVEDADDPPRDVLVTLNTMTLRARWVTSGTLADTRRALSMRPRPDLLVGSRLSQAARELTQDAGVGWVDETGAANVTTKHLLISRQGHRPSRPASGRVATWTPAVQGVAEALLVGTRPTVDGVVSATGVAPSTAAAALRFLTDEGLLVATAARGRRSGRTIPDPLALLNAYAAAVSALPIRFSRRVGTTWRDPIAGATEAGRTWTSLNVAWAATGALSAAAVAPLVTQVSPMVIYLEAPSLAALTAAAAAAGLPPIEGGRLMVRPFPGTVTRRLTQTLDSGLNTVPWPRAYADLRPTGVRGEEAAEHLAERMLDDHRP